MRIVLSLLIYRRKGITKELVESLVVLFCRTGFNFSFRSFTIYGDTQSSTIHSWTSISVQ